MFTLLFHILLLGDNITRSYLYHSSLYAEKSGDPSMESGISFAQWMGFAFPASLLVVIVSWFWLLIVFLRCR